MGVAHVTFVEDCDVVVGGAPDDSGEPITNPKKVGRTNTDFPLPDGIHCFSITAAPPFSPLWQLGQVVPGTVLALTFTRP